MDLNLGLVTSCHKEVFDMFFTLSKYQHNQDSSLRQVIIAFTSAQIHNHHII